MKKVSFVIPSYNCAAWLPHAVKSCQEQTIKDIEIVIVDDCSTDTTEQYIGWLLKQGDKRIKYFRNGKNVGRSESRNYGNKMASGDVICVLDADDLAMPNRVEWTLKKMKSADVIYGSAVVMDALGAALNEIHAGPIDLTNCLKNKLNGIVHSTMAYTKEMATKYPYAGGEICKLGLDDWQMQLRMLANGERFDFVPDVITAYRTMGNNTMNTRDNEAVAKAKDAFIETLGVKA